MSRLALLLVFLHSIVCSVLWRMAQAEVLTPRQTFKAAVYSHAVILTPDPTRLVSRAEALAHMYKNLDVYRAQAEEAKRQGADILVFPEDGLYGMNFTRESLFPYLEIIPYPYTYYWSPCSDPHRHPHTEVLRALSCMAKDNSLYLVANMGDLQPCNIHQDPDCPKDGRYQFNTDVAFGPDGTLLAKYHKSHLFYENAFNAPFSEIVFFDTPFGRFGMMICFDILFEDPGVPMVLSSNISNIAFPTWWFDTSPLVSALGYHSSFARALGINLLAANSHHPEMRSHGSGIYTPNGTRGFYYGTNGSPPNLLVKELEVLVKPRPNINVPPKAADPSFARATCEDDSNNHGMARLLQDDEFYSLMFMDKFTFTTLDDSSGSLKICQKDVCCDLQYTIDEENFGKELFAFGAFDGLHTYLGRFYFQICALVKCANTTNRASCGAVTHTSTTPFKKIDMQGRMTTYFIYPQVMLSNDEGELQLAEEESWGFKNASLWTNTSLDKPILSAALFGRCYERDMCYDKDSHDVDGAYNSKDEM